MMWSKNIYIFVSEKKWFLFAYAHIWFIFIDYFLILSQIKTTNNKAHWK